MTSARHISPSIGSVCSDSAPTITHSKLADYDAHFVLKPRPRSQIDGDGIAVPGAIDREFPLPPPAL